MKIGIITLPLHTNYGGILQAYALQTVLERMGHEVTVLDKGWPRKSTCSEYIKRVVKQSLRKIIGRTHQRWHWIYFQEKEIREEHRYTFQFVNKNIHRRVQPNLYDIKENEFDCFVVGSDQIWREPYYRPIENAYLDFTKGWTVKRVAFAASFGTDDWEYSSRQTSYCAQLLKEFDAISVREKNGIYLCRDHFHCEAQHVLDPTLLLTSDEYVRCLGLESVERSSGDFLVYVLDMNDEKNHIVDYIAQKYNLTPFYVNSKCDDKTCKLKDRIQPPIEKWLRGFFDAKFVFTDSFHACAFAINFNKPFFVYGNKERGLSRFESLLSSFGLNDRLIDSAKLNNDLNMENIIWLEINKQLDKKRFESLEFLSKNV